MSTTFIPKDITKENFAAFGQLIHPGEDGDVYDPEEEAALDLSQGQPRLYIMRLRDRKPQFDRITFHRNVTQCLGGLTPAQEWYLAVSKPTMDVKSYPDPSKDIEVFRIPHGVFVKLHKGTWHAGPLFLSPVADFYNLELTDTNVVDHNTHVYDATLHVQVD